jgi:two-component system, cell cycle sensor histidine kinase and response regulator CckA
MLHYKLPSSRRLALITLVGSTCVVAVALASVLSGSSLWPALLLSLALILLLAWSAILFERDSENAASQLCAANEEWSQAEEKLRGSEERFRQLIHQAADSILLYNSQFRFVEVNRQACETLGYTREELLVLSVSDVELPTGEADVFELQEQMVQGRPVTANMVYRRKDGSTFPAEVRVTLLQIGGHAYKLLLIRDVTERMRAEAELREQRNLLRDVLENIPCAVFRKDRDSVYLGCNKLFARSRGFSSDVDVIGKTDEEAGLTAAQAAAATRTDREVIRTGRPAMNMEEKFQAAGTAGPTYLLTSVVPLFDGAGRAAGVLGVSTDITDRKRLEEKYRQSQKMEAVGRLAGGIAHDFNNLLTIINNYAQLVSEDLVEADPSREMLGKIILAGERAAALTGQLLAYGRRQVLQPKVVDLNKLVTNLERMLRPLIGEDVELSTELRDGVYPVRVDPGQFEQVLMNLAVNARDAMPNGGKLIIATQNIEREDVPVVADSTYQACPYVMLEVRDTGVGIDAATKANIFEPFFTTKAIGKGTGLGLATVHGIVKQSGGFISVESEPGCGASFQIFIPASDRKVVDVTDSRLSVGAIPKGTETVMLVEDESGVRSLTQVLLRKCGYLVLEAASGADALKIATRHNGPIHLLLTDVVMPGMSGRHLAELFVSQFPQAKVLYVSGYTDDTMVQHGIQGHGAAFLPKPFTLRGLASKVREVLDSKTAETTAPSLSTRTMNSIRQRIS